MDAFAVGVQVDWCVGEDETGFLGFEGFFAEGLEEIGGGILGVLRGSFEGFGGGEAGRRIGAEFDWCLGLLVWFGGHLFGCFAVEWMCLGVVARVRWHSYITAMKEQHRALLATLVLLGLMIADQQSFIALLPASLGEGSRPLYVIDTMAYDPHDLMA